MEYNFKKGFTLIELLVVIAIIGILSTVVLGQLNDARTKAFDARRISDLKNIQIALELYRDDNGQYPVVSTVHASSDASGLPTFRTIGWETDLATALQGYIVLPKDPVSNNTGGLWPLGGGGLTYFYSSDGDDYDLVTNLQTNHNLTCQNRGGYTRHSVSTGDWCDDFAEANNLNLYSVHND